MKIGTWNVTLLNGKEIELIEEVKKYQLDVIGISSFKKKDNGWQLFYFGIDPTIHAQVGVAILLHSRLVDTILEWKPINERIILLKLQLNKSNTTVIQVYAPNVKADYAAFLDTLATTMENIPVT
ncbi:unnamed protein product [Rotaria sordida]|uniref:Endonuclease/exonuclease/phosphatase domain-containing protein n=1 Tax=Rotaria sordida TaxID=392033 RepID=A0A819KIU0_9BILA|nr:unnamed protein product [Rotaria sordida]CAF3946819.1 unnamed protein product [Rotaria sordida]